MHPEINKSALSVPLMVQVRSLSDGTLSACVRDENSRTGAFEGLNYRSGTEIKKFHDDFVGFAFKHKNQFQCWQDAFHAYVTQIGA